MARAVHGSLSICGTRPSLWGGGVYGDAEPGSAASAPGPPLPLRHPSAHLPHHPAPTPLKLIPIKNFSLSYCRSWSSVVWIKAAVLPGLWIPPLSPMAATAPLCSRYHAHTFITLKADSSSIELFFWGTKRFLWVQYGLWLDRVGTHTWSLTHHPSRYVFIEQTEGGTGGWRRPL